jgi:glycosyltransferase involved in cell wall biosynthesis
MNANSVQTQPETCLSNGKPEAARQPSIAVLIPCYNEALTVANVVTGFRAALPEATIYVYDNNSTDGTAEIARKAGAVVRRENRQGKGYVIQSMFRDIDADYYVMADGDGTYPPDQVEVVLGPIRRGDADMVVGNRLQEFTDQAFRPLHVFGNKLVVGSINLLFGAKLKDVMSGYRAFNRRFVLEIPFVSRGFEVETEMTLQALDRRLAIAEVEVPYGSRPAGSHSKLSTFRDGFRVLLKLFNILKAYRPLLFFGGLGILICLLGLLIGIVPIAEYLRTGLVTRFPTAILAASIEIVGIVVGIAGIILDSLNQHFRELASQVVKMSARPHAQS